VSVRETPSRAGAAPKKRKPVVIDPREEAATVRPAPRTTKRRAATADSAALKPILQPTLDTIATPVIARRADDDGAGLVHLPPIRLQPDAPPEERAERVDPVTAWVPTVLAPAPVRTPAPVEPVAPEPTMLQPTVFEPEPEAELVPDVVPLVATAPALSSNQQTRVAKSGRRPRRRVRRVTRVVRHVDPWSVFKVALVFSIVLYGICLTTGVLLWNVAYTTGTIDNLQKFFESFGWSSFRFKGGQLFHNAWIAGLFGALGLTGLSLLGATLFNLITDLVGGIRVTVLEEEVVERHPSTATPRLHARAVRPSEPIDEGPVWVADDSEEQPG
jgi:hypothetical protein